MAADGADGPRPGGHAPHGIDAVRLRLPGEQVDERADGGRRGASAVLEVAEQGDAHGARVVARGVRSDDPEATLVGPGVRTAVGVRLRPATLVDPTRLVDEEVVADVRPATALDVVPVDPSDRGGGVGQPVAGLGGVVHHHAADRREAR